MALQLRNGPQSRAPLKWGGVAKNPTANRHQGCPTNAPFCPKTKGSNSMRKETKATKTEVEGLNVGTWNVWTMQKNSKLENIKRDIRKTKLNVLGLSEGWWDVAEDELGDEFRVIHSGSESGQGGVGIILDRELGKRVTKVVRHSHRCFWWGWKPNQWI